MNFTAEQLQSNYQKFLGYIDQYISGDRKAKLMKFYEDHAERIMLMPAASVDHHYILYLEDISSFLEIMSQILHPYLTPLQ